MNIETNQDDICPSCKKGILKTSERGIFAAGIFYKCCDCGAEFKKTNITDMKTGTTYYWMLPVGQFGGIW